ncbi:GyrI-like domain-containing protein [Chryseolinea sp. H1M3-3]|uniref:GyrI-like domain-containing protein n=1 Tax=Chryseolinea sp. H1M3-3 TaxID=3034144 RepID=UPI0023ED05B7|nr:GyrI-like domain-containing protein [Chryseolinea sp. H1M3-3]
METIVNYDVKLTTWPEKTFVTKRGRIKFDELSTFFGEAYGALYAVIQKLGLTPDGMPYAIYYDIDEFSKETDVAAAVAVQGKVPEIKGFDKVVLPTSKVLSTTHYGAYENMASAYDALDKYVRQNSLKKEMVLEEYFSDPVQEKDSSKWKTNIHFVVR